MEMLLVVSVVLGRTWAGWTTVGVLITFLVVWYAIPLISRHSASAAPGSAGMVRKMPCSSTARR